MINLGLDLGFLFLRMKRCVTRKRQDQLCLIDAESVWAATAVSPGATQQATLVGLRDRN